ncbi:phosphate ABC transporter substrate-binding protein [Bacterioplanes sanyensis]|uniref:Phosphate ABC transporter substrate-binding protein n=1 Tax=Bacterioplanes sanyensis TaxID=1249553 RepID=A0A222FFZ7_9GAMM|nr:substrate-binding domain-containing protein [Bacterioplanes sanyensis]ASP38005.1 phosphate ABC transporter substrate-binding protein [Bacterioplanes sanyensis]
MKKALLTGAALVATLVGSAAHAERDYISIVGSSTVYPFSIVVAERFGKSTNFPTPKVESTGSGGGLKLFCSGVGGSTPDITNASRAIKQSEIDLCAKNGVNDIIEVKAGYDGIVLANTLEAERIELTTKDIFLALAKNIPNPDGSDTLVENPHKTWKDVNPALPAREIEVLGPPPTSGTRDAFVELAMEGGCKQFPFIKAMKKADKSKYKAVCHGMREDGAYIEAGENDNLIVQKLVTNPAALGIFGFSFLEQNADKVQGSLINGKEPTFDNISSGAYPVSRSLYFYVKKAHIDVIPGIEEYLAEFTSDRAMGEYGYLAEKGMIPMKPAEMATVRENVKSQKTLAAN